MTVAISWTDDTGQRRTAKATPLAWFTALDRSNTQRKCLYCGKRQGNRDLVNNFARHKPLGRLVGLRWIDIHGVGLRWAHDVCMPALEGRSAARRGL